MGVFTWVRFPGGFKWFSQNNRVGPGGPCFVMKGLSLIEATINIQMSLPDGKSVTSIEFEDGTGLKFNYCVDNLEWQFIDFNKVPLIHVLTGLQTRRVDKMFLINRSLKNAQQS
jgi:hypothetical protein